LRPTVAGSGLRTTIRGEQVFISRWLSPRTPEAWTPEAWMPGATDPLRLHEEAAIGRVDLQVWLS
jgi:hypothetical protein